MNTAPRVFLHLLRRYLNLETSPNHLLSPWLFLHSFETLLADPPPFRFIELNLPYRSAPAPVILEGFIDGLAQTVRGRCCSQGTLSWFCLIKFFFFLLILGLTKTPFGEYVLVFEEFFSKTKTWTCFSTCMALPELTFGIPQDP